MNLPEQLAAIVGAANVLTTPEDTAPYLTDWRRRYHGTAAAIVRPAATDEVARIVRLCAASRVPIVPQGGNTGLVGGATPDDSGAAVVVSLQRMNRIRAIDTANDTITVEAGCVLQAVQDAARAAQRLFPLSLAAEGSATIGGNLSSNAGGTQVLRYGNARELALGLEVVLPGGDVWDGLRGLRKDNTGYDLKQLFIGAEGTLGIITAATLKLFAQPAAQITAIAALASLPDASDLLGRMRGEVGPELTAFEVMSANALRCLLQQFPDKRLPVSAPQPWYALVELSDHESAQHATERLEAVLGAALDAGVVRDAAVAQSIADAQAMWAIREGIPEAQLRAGGNVKHDVSLPISAIPEFVAATNAALEARFPWIEPITFGHLGDGNLHYNFGTKAGIPVAVAFEHQHEISTVVHDAVAARGGSISAEHGLGQLKRDEIRRFKSPIELDLMRRIKAALDPDNLMNPGKVI
jgi:FAD/FMN-containing dehydrogenase